MNFHSKSFFRFDYLILLKLALVLIKREQILIDLALELINIALVAINFIFDDSISQ